MDAIEDSINEIKFRAYVGRLGCMFKVQQGMLVDFTTGSIRLGFIKAGRKRLAGPEVRYHADRQGREGDEENEQVLSHFANCLEALSEDLLTGARRTKTTDFYLNIRTGEYREDN